MAYSADVVQRARARLAQARADRESENQEHLARAYAQVPRLREIDMQLRRTMALAAQAAFAKGGDVQETIGAVRQANLALQRERAGLVAAHFEEGFLDDSPICDRCGGTGYLGSHMCECLAELCRQEQKQELNLLAGGRESFSQFRLDYYPDRYDPKFGASPRAIMERNFKICRTYALTFTRMRYLSGGDYGRTDRQRRVIVAIAESLRDADLMTIFNLIDQVLPHIVTNLTDAQIVEYATAGLGILAGGGEMETFRIPQDDAHYNASIRGMAVLVPDLEMCREDLQEFLYGNEG